MFLPDSLSHACSRILENRDSSLLREAASQLSCAYRAQDFGLDMQKKHAYLACRLPATYAALYTVLTELKQSCDLSSLLDLGAGPGTAFWATRALWGEGVAITCMEQDGDWKTLAQKLGCDATWITANIETLSSLPTHDVALFGYSLGELSSLEPLLTHYWRLAQQAIVIVEPGTPRGYQTILRARAHLLSLGAHVLAPCPHALPCPLPEKEWCHFSVRLNRTALHRWAKWGTLCYEDEKYSYLIMTKSPLNPTPSPLIHSPLERKGHVKLTLCTPRGICEHTLCRHRQCIRSLHPTEGSSLQEPITLPIESVLYKQARKASWGDRWPPSADLLQNPNS